MILQAIVVSSPNNPDSSRKGGMVKRRQNGRCADKLYLQEKFIINTTETGHRKKCMARCVCACRMTVGTLRCMQKCDRCVQNLDRYMQDRSACVHGVCTSVQVHGWCVDIFFCAV